MENSKLKRINELAAIAKQRELTPEEFEERAQLRKEYIEEFRAGAMQILDNTYVQTPDGKKHKLQRKNCSKKRSVEKTLLFLLADDAKADTIL